MRYKICRTFEELYIKGPQKLWEIVQNTLPRMKSSTIISFLLIGIVQSGKNDKFPELINSEPWLYRQRLGVFHHKLPKRAKKESIVIKQQLIRMKIAKMIGQVKKLWQKEGEFK